jgi:RimJ/RimL family protein N-acetyltransferase
MTTILELDPRSPGTLHALLPVVRRAVAADLPRHPEPDAGWLRVVTASSPIRERRILAARDAAGTVVSVARLQQDAAANRTLCHGNIWTVPERRDGPAEAALIGQAKELAVEAGCDRLVLDDPASERTTALHLRHGARVVGSEKRSMLDLAALDRDRFAAWAAPSAANADYRVAYWTEPTPDHFAAAFAVARDAMNDAPHGELEIERAPADLEQQRQGERFAAALGLRGHVLAAFAPSGEIAGFSSLHVFPGAMPMASVGSTAVVAAHRGRGLGLRLKADLTLRVLALEPRLTSLETWNDEANAPMLRVNRLLGYELADAWNTFQYEL